MTNAKLFFVTNLLHMFKGTTISSFRKQFVTDYDCIDYLANLKWQDGYACRKCNHTSFSKGRMYGYRRCTNCRYDESAISHTVFHSMNIPLLTAFEICYQVAISKKSMSNYEISRQYGIHVNTALYLRERIQAAMKSSAQYPLEDKVEVDEFVVGGHEENKPGRSSGEKKKAIIGAEIRGKSKKGFHYGRVYIQTIEDYSSKSFKPFFETHIDKKAMVKTDKWSGYIPLKEAFTNLEQEKSNPGKNFHHIHTLIMNFKGWLRGIHHKCSSKKFQNYLDEFCFKFNRRQFLTHIAARMLK
jgi:DNA-binding CsgD family transcriptional regulator